MTVFSRFGLSVSLMHLYSVDFCVNSRPFKRLALLRWIILLSGILFFVPVNSDGYMNSKVSFLLLRLLQKCHRMQFVNT